MFAKTKLSKPSVPWKRVATALNLIKARPNRLQSIFIIDSAAPPDQLFTGLFFVAWKFVLNLAFWYCCFNFAWEMPMTQLPNFGHHGWSGYHLSFYSAAAIYPKRQNQSASVALANKPKRLDSVLLSKRQHLFAVVDQAQDFSQHLTHFKSSLATKSIGVSRDSVKAMKIYRQPTD